MQAKLLGIEALEPAKDVIVKALDEAKRKAYLAYADVRLDLGEGKAVFALQGNAKGATEDNEMSCGVRVYVEKGGVASAGFVGRSLGEQELNGLAQVLKEMHGLAYKRARANQAHKRALAKKYKFFGKSLTAGKLAPVKACVDTLKPSFKRNPRDYSFEELVRRTERCSQLVQKLPGMASNSVSIVTGLGRQLFASTEGAFIDDSNALTQGFLFVTAKGKAVETFYEWNGAYAGLEVLEGENGFRMNFEDFCQYIAEGTIEVSNAPAMKTTEKPMTVICDPRFNALVSHEICGHPSEADRALKREAAWAGRAWWFRGMDDNEFGKPVASEQVSVFSDPSLQGYGNYKYDDEGVPAKKVYNIKEGRLNAFINSRETATILGQEPNGGMRAASAMQVPLIRMNNTCLDKGDWSKDEIFKDTREGYYLFGQKTPSIGETRQNFKITCWKLYKVENGELTQLYRMGGITADSAAYLKSIDAAADDLHVHNIPNCGKGTPMQSMMVGNGGPHTRGKAIVTGAHAEGRGSL
ncbi:MAG: TldD/PmbA family protein [Candidatus Diapherotrites archaeon]|uniref:TldD/PmbA family protein n=2 Tax=Candidatus Iainarchaeum sp. TaxID=3101447 RepID=A0A8T4L6D9_9ARCH|nr:TldD/PmbA family protein [Candidatus Diapherotrites archaeon]